MHQGYFGRPAFAFERRAPKGIEEKKLRFPKKATEFSDCSIFILLGTITKMLILTSKARHMGAK